MFLGHYSEGDINFYNLIAQQSDEGAFTLLIDRKNDEAGTFLFLLNIKIDNGSPSEEIGGGNENQVTLFGLM